MQRRVSEQTKHLRRFIRAGQVVKVRRDWGAILRNLAVAGVPLQAVARACCREPSTVQAWGRGGEPKESDGRIVLALYAQHCPALYLADELTHAVHLPG